MAVEEIFMPVGASVGGIGDLCVETHDCRKDLGKEKDGQAREEGGVDLGGAGSGFALRYMLAFIQGGGKLFRKSRLTDFGLGVGHCRNNDPNRKHGNTEDLYGSIAVPPDESNQHCRDAAATP